MARKTITIPLNISKEDFEGLTTAFLSAKGFKAVNYKKTICWKRGVGLLTAPQYIYASYDGANLTIEYWTKYTVFIGLYVGEGMFGVVPVQMVKKVVDGYIKAITNDPNYNYPPAAKKIKQ